MAQPTSVPVAGPPSAAADAEPCIPRQSLAAVFLRFLRFGSLAWGGPIAQIAMIQRELVDEERWISHDRFRRALAVYQVLPGPEAHELCVYFGMLARGRAGAVLAGLGFMLPGFVLMLVMSALYANGTLSAPALRPAFLGLQAAVVALITVALYRIGRHSLHDAWLAVLGMLALVATLAGVHFALVLVFAGTAYVLARKRLWWAAAVTAVVFAGAALAIATLTPEPSHTPTPGPVGQPTTMGLFFSGLRGGLLTFGGAYTVIPFLQRDAVLVGQWMTDAQFLEAVALSGVLPAPMIIFATCVGYVGGGLAGAIAMTVGIFLPAFCFTLVGHALFERITGHRGAHQFLQGVTAGVVGIMAATTIELARVGIVDHRSAAIALSAVAVLWVWKSRAAVPLVVLGGGLCGLLLFRG